MNQLMNGGKMGGHPSSRAMRGLSVPQSFNYTQIAQLLMVLVLLIGILPVYAQEEAVATEPVTVIDAFGEEVVITDTSRIVSIGGSVTEIVFALGAGDQVIARDMSSLYPPAVNELESVGYVRQISSEPIVALDPTLIITNLDAGPPEAIEQLKAVGIPFFVIPGDDTVEGVSVKIEAVAQALGLEEAGAELIAKHEAAYAQAQELLETVESAPTVMFIYARGAGAVSVAGEGTSAHTMIELAGGVNAVEGHSGYQPITAESVVASAPEIILLMTRGLESLGGIDGLLEQPGIAQTPAGENRRVIAVDDLYLLGFSDRLGNAVLDLTYLLHDELETPITTLLRADGRFDTFLNALEIGGQTEFLTTGGPFTVFAPTDEAYLNAFPAEVLAGFFRSVISVQSTNSYHFVEGVYSAEALAELEEISTLYPSGNIAISTSDEGGLLLNGAVNVTTADIEAGNGVIHIIDSLLVPERP